MASVQHWTARVESLSLPAAVALGDLPCFAWKRSTFRPSSEPLNKRLGPIAGGPLRQDIRMQPESSRPLFGKASSWSQDGVENLRLGLNFFGQSTFFCFCMASRCDRTRSHLSCRPASPRTCCSVLGEQRAVVGHVPIRVSRMAILVLQDPCAGLDVAQIGSWFDANDGSLLSMS